MQVAITKSGVGRPESTARTRVSSPHPRVRLYRLLRPGRQVHRRNGREVGFGPKFGTLNPDCSSYNPGRE